MLTSILIKTLDCKHLIAPLIRQTKCLLLATESLSTLHAYFPLIIKLPSWFQFIPFQTLKNSENKNSKEFLKIGSLCVHKVRKNIKISELWAQLPRWLYCWIILIRFLSKLYLLGRFFDWKLIFDKFFRKYSSLKCQELKKECETFAMKEAAVLEFSDSKTVELAHFSSKPKAIVHAF